MIYETPTIKVVHKLIPNVDYISIDPANFDPDVMSHYQEAEVELPKELTAKELTAKELTAKELTAKELAAKKAFVAGDNSEGRG